MAKTTYYRVSAGLTVKGRVCEENEIVDAAEFGDHFQPLPLKTQMAKFGRVMYSKYEPTKTELRQLQEAKAFFGDDEEENEASDTDRATEASDEDDEDGDDSTAGGDVDRAKVLRERIASIKKMKVADLRTEAEIAGVEGADVIPAERLRGLLIKKIEEQAAETDKSSDDDDEGDE